MTVPEALKTAWETQSVWSQAANRLKRRLTRARVSVFVLSILAAVLGTLGSHFVGGYDALASLGKGLGVAAAVSIAAAGFLKARLLNRDQVRNWTRARSVSEAIKKHVYLYLTGAGDYREGDPARKLSKAVADLVDRVKHLETLAARIDPEERPVPPPMDGHAYVKHRVTPQIDGYYRPKARELATKLARLRAVEFALMGAAAILGGTALLGTEVRTAAWVAVITTVTGAILAHVESARYEQSVISYRATANRLTSLRDTWPGTQEETARFVKDCEDAISVENQGWMAEWSDAQ